jgi:dTDP-D-glucose 4,6-dehydratase
LLGWHAETSFDAGVRSTVEWFENTPERFKPEIYNI